MFRARYLTQRMQSPSHLERLEEALRLHGEFLADGTSDPRTFLARHEELRDLLEPMLFPGTNDSSAAEPHPLAPSNEDPLGLEGKELAGLRFGALLGRGGMGLVYGAIEVDLDRPVAVKLLDPSRFVLHNQQRFQREAMLHARLQHEHIATLYRAGTLESLGDIPFLVMELVPQGRTMSGLIAVLVISVPVGTSSTSQSSLSRLPKHSITRMKQVSRLIATSSPPTFCSRKTVPLG